MPFVDGGASRREHDYSVNKDTKNIVIIGNGLIGCLTAYFLKYHTPNLKNKNIIVVDRHDKIAQETSFANAGRFCPSSISLHTPNKSFSPLKLFIPDFILKLKYMREKNKTADPFIPEKLQTFSKLAVTPSLIHFGLFNIGFLQNFVSSKYYVKPASEHTGKARRILAKLAIESMDAIINENKYIKEHIQYNQGTLYLYGTAFQRDYYDKCKIANMLENNFNRTRTYPKHKCYQLYPWLKTFKQYSAGYNFPGCSVIAHDWTADAHLFTTFIASKLLNNSRTMNSNSVSFKYNTTVKELLYKNDDPKECIGVAIDDGSGSTIIECEKVIVCAGINTPKLTSLKLPMHGMQGYSIDLLDCRSTEGDNLPSVAIADQGSDQLYFQITPYKNGRIRLVGFGNFTNEIPNDKATLQYAETLLLNYFKYSFPNIKFNAKKKIWSGIRPLSPDNFPIIGKDINASNVYINSGQGPHGWTLSALSGFLISYIINQEENNISKIGNEKDEDVELLLRYVDPSRFHLY